MLDSRDVPANFDRETYLAENRFELATEFASIEGSTVFAAVTSDSANVVVKHVDDERSYRQEVSGVASLVGHGGVVLISRDDDAHVFVMERAMPGTSARDLPDDEAMTLVGQAIVAMRGIEVPPVGTETLADQMQGFAKWESWYGGSGPIDRAAFARAQSLSIELIASAESNVFLHADLHLNNLLRHGDRWATIDPKGIVGDEVFEVATTLRARQKHGAAETLALPDPTADWAPTIQRKLDVLHEVTGFDRQRMFEWSFVLSVLSPMWTMDARL